MDIDAARFWDQRYRSREEAHEHGPAPFLVENANLLPAGGRALDVGMGTGRNALYLASVGFEVVGVDISRVACQKALASARKAGLRIDAVCADIDHWEIPPRTFDVVLNFFFLKRALCPRLSAALRPGGVLVFQTFTTEQRQFGWGPSHDDFLLRPGELPTLFPELQTLVYREGIEEGEHGRTAVAGLVARRPA